MADSFTVTRSTSIAAPAARVYAHVHDLREWGKWSPWDAMDPAMVKTFSDDQGTVGSHYSWVGNRKVGEGRMKIVGLEEPTKVDLELEFLKPFKAQNGVTLDIEPSGDGATSDVTWSMTGKLNFMMKIMGIFKSMDDQVGPDFEKGLASLKKLSELP